MQEMKERAKSVWSSFAFELFLEVYHDQLIAGLQKWLEGFTIDQVRQMIQATTFPNVPPGAFMAARDFVNFIDNITAIRLMEAIAEARPDIAQAVMDAGDTGRLYMEKLRDHLVACVKEPGVAPVSAPAQQKTTVLVTCDQCQKSFPADDQMKQCPFCGAPAN